MPLDLNTLTLATGTHTSQAEGISAWEARNLLASNDALFSNDVGDGCPVLHAYIKAINDALGDTPRQELKQYLVALAADKAPNADVQDRRAFTCIDRMIRVFFPLCLDPALAAIGTELSALPSFMGGEGKHHAIEDLEDSVEDAEEEAADLSEDEEEEEEDEEEIDESEEEADEVADAVDEQITTLRKKLKSSKRPGDKKSFREMIAYAESMKEFTGKMQEFAASMSDASDEKQAEIAAEKAKWEAEHATREAERVAQDAATKQDAVMAMTVVVVVVKGAIQLGHTAEAIALVPELLAISVG